MALAERLAGVLPHVAFSIADDPECAVRAADVVITATTARNPIVRGEWLQPGRHITAIGADDATKCKLNITALRRARVFVDASDTAAANGCIHRAIRDGGYAQKELAGEIGDVIADRILGRMSPDDITIAKFVGIGAQDLVAAETAVALMALP
jgi:ornithine cyclodeaminase/alanine dehydrogenase-like protein (mu-crystallin family)